MTLCSSVDGCCFGGGVPSTDDLYQLRRRGTDEYVVPDELIVNVDVLNPQ